MAAPSTSRESPVPARSQSPPPPKVKKPVIKPIPPKKATVRDIFGTDSEDEDQDQPVAGKPIQLLQSYMTRRLANGHSRQTCDTKKGSHYIELKVYNCDEIEKVSPMNRWRHAIVCVKNKTDENTEAWQHLTNFIIATRKEFRNCPINFISNYY